MPVLVSDCGGLPETLGNAGFMFTIPERYGPRSPALSTARGPVRVAARRWEPDRIADRFVRLFQRWGL